MGEDGSEDEGVGMEGSGLQGRGGWDRRLARTCNRLTFEMMQQKLLVFWLLAVIQPPNISKQHPKTLH